MSEKDAQNNSDVDMVHEEVILDYLKEHPDFFMLYPDLVEEMNIPHACGGAVSLIEHQVNVLKDKNRIYRHKLRELIDIARENDQPSEKMHHLSLELISSKDLDDVLVALQDSMRTQFDVDAVHVVLLSSGPDQTEQSNVEFVDPNAPELKGFESLFNGERPICGRLKNEQMTYLFGETAERIGSAALLPLVDDRRYGLIAIGSFNAARFNPSMGTHFLRHIADMVCWTLKPFLKPTGTAQSKASE